MSWAILLAKLSLFFWFLILGYTTVSVSKHLLCFRLCDVFVFFRIVNFLIYCSVIKDRMLYTYEKKNGSMQFVREVIFFIGSMYSLGDCKQNGQNGDIFQTIKRMLVLRLCCGFTMISEGKNSLKMHILILE